MIATLPKQKSQHLLQSIWLYIDLKIEAPVIRMSQWCQNIGLNWDLRIKKEKLEKSETVDKKEKFNVEKEKLNGNLTTKKKPRTEN